MQILFLGVEESSTTTAKASCSFPFKWNGHTYNACTIAGDSQGRYWCAINTKDSSEDMEGTGKWVWCNSRTSTKGTRKCKLPFKYRGSIYYTCTSALDVLFSPFDWQIFFTVHQGGDIEGYKYTIY